MVIPTAVVVVQNNSASVGGVANASSRLVQAFTSQLPATSKVLGVSLWGHRNALYPQRPRALWRAAADRSFQSKLARLDFLGQRSAVATLRRIARDEESPLIIAMDVLAAQILADTKQDHAVTLGQFHNSYAALASGRDLTRFIRAGRALSGVCMLTDEDASCLSRHGLETYAVPNVGAWRTPLEFVAAQPGTRFVAAGRLVAAKNFSRLISAWGQVHPLRPGWNLDIFGSGPLRAALEQEIRDQGLAGVVRLRGHTSNLQHEIATSQALVLSSDYEGLPLVVSEALSLGVPVVATDSGPGVRQQIQESQGGWLSSADEIGLARAILAAIDHPTEREVRGRRGREWASRFTGERVVQAWLDIYRQHVH